MRREQHAVTENVTRHVADAGYAELGGLCIHAERAEMAFYRFPCTSRRDAHLLVVVAHRSTGGERVTEPETVVGRHAVGDVRESRGSLVCGHYQVGVVLVVSHKVRGRHNRAPHNVVSQVEQPAKEQPVAGYALGQVGFAISRRGRLFQYKTTLRADWHDDRVFHLLRFHQAQNFCTEIFAPVRPAQAPARHLATAQMHPLNTRRVDPDFE